jgi:hypothetical protein
MKTVGGAGVGMSRGGIFWLILGLALIAAPEVRAACDCVAENDINNPTHFAWLANTKVRFNNDAYIVGNVGANLPGGQIKFGKRSCQGLNEGSPCTGNSVAVFADRLIVGNDSSIAGSRSNHLKIGPGGVVRNPPLLSVNLPLVSGDPSSVCGAFTDPTCGGSSISVPWYANAGTIPPGSYDTLVIGNGATFTLSAGSYSFCSVKIGSNVTGNIDENTVFNVVGKFSMGSGTLLTTPGGPFVLNSGGPLVRLSQASVLEAEVRAPYGKIRMQRQSLIRGCSCSETITCDKNHGNICESGGGGGGSASGAFVD